MENGALTATAPQGSNHHYIWLMSTGEYENFELKMKVQTFADAKGNSGIQIRSRYDETAFWLDGPHREITRPV